jgi:cell wall-associated NlpC family hydrolase
MLRTLVARFSFSLLLCLVCFAAAAPSLAANTVYIVQPGDTLFSLSQRLHVSIATLTQLNHLSDANYLRLGQRIQLAAPRAISHRNRPATKKIAALARHRRVATAKIVRHHRLATVRSHRQPMQNSAGSVVATEAIWVATHAGASSPSFSLSPAYIAAQRTLAFELRLTRTAMRFLGVPYVWGGTSFSGVDCSGFVQAVFHRNGIDLPRTADAQFGIGQAVRERSLRPGDLVFFQTYSEGASHVGIYVGNGNFVHASSSNGVRVDSLTESYYASRYIGARRAL